jgi:phosphatidylserine/phosphatidylglycerophosphate/cardiolipin synthase-like enzyme
MKRGKKLKLPPSTMFVILFMVGFGAGYTTKDYIPPSQEISQLPLSPSTPVAEGDISLCFTPNKRCQSLIIGEIGQAKQSIFVQAYSFTDKEIARALAEAAKRGVMVKVILDKSNRKDERSAKSILQDQKIPFRFDAPSGIAHNKIMIIDAAKVISGSYNFSAAAYKRNTENLLVIRNASLAKDYIQNWQGRWNVSK